MGKILLILLGVLLLFLLISFVRHRIQLHQEKALLNPMGNLVEVNGHKMNVYTEGDGDKTLVFMSGGGTCSPVLDFRSLYSLLSDKYKIIVVEKAGYGFSEDADISRDIETILSETRQALQMSNLTGPYILCPHSMSGIEALYWAQKFPEEVTAIIGLDMAVPEAYENYKINMPILKLGAFAAHMGITRWLPGLAESDAIQFGTLTPKEKELYRALFYRGTATRAMLNEARRIKENALLVEENGLIGGEKGDVGGPIPMLLFCSNGEGTGWDKAAWRGFQETFAQSLEGVTLVPLDCPHYVHDHAYQEIAEIIEGFLSGRSF